MTEEPKGKRMTIREQFESLLKSHQTIIVIGTSAVTGNAADGETMLCRGIAEMAHAENLPPLYFLLAARTLLDRIQNDKLILEDDYLLKLARASYEALNAMLEPPASKSEMN